MKILVLVEDYPSANGHALMYVHVRNKYYTSNGIDVTVLNFRAKEDYIYDDINVITLDSYKKNASSFDVLICHAANIKHHYVFLNKYEKRFERIIFFYHGHEILKINEVYPPQYDWVSKKKHTLIRNIYDEFKFILWRKKIKKLLYKSELVFVSKWLYDRFLYYIHLNPKIIEEHVHIINNSVGSIFEKENYKINIKKEYDFITIRGSALDGSKYGVDIVTQLAKNNPKSKFLVIGKGDFYKNNAKPKNLIHMEKFLSHSEMIDYLNKSRCALLPTRQDTQGVVTCEVATLGIPTITSNISVCREIFENFDNVILIDNDDYNIDLNNKLKELEKKLPFSKNRTYFANNTIKKEVELIKRKQ